MRSIGIGALIGVLCLWAAGVAAQDLSALARLDPAASSVADRGDGVTLRLALSQPVPWRVRVLDQPPRLVLDFREVDWAGIDRVQRTSARIGEVRAGMFRPGWSRLVVELAGPMTVARAGMETGGQAAVVEVTLTPADAAAFAAQAARPEPPEWALPEAAQVTVPVRPGEGPVVVVLDPGHGGIDPGAERDGQSEADLMLAFARDLKEALVREGIEVILTREEDVFVPLETRISIARAARASLLISLHADALAEGEATGATIYALSDEASDAAAQTLAERHDRDDLLAGIDLSQQDDLVAGVLMDMARTETAPRTDRLALALEVAIKAADLKMHRHPRQEAGFSVLKSPDIPSVLIEIGFLSSTADFKRLTDKEWRASMAGAIVAGVAAWAEEDAALRARRTP